MGHGMRWDGMGWDGMGKEVLSFSRFIHTGGVLPPFSGIHYSPPAFQLVRST